MLKLQVYVSLAPLHWLKREKKLQGTNLTHEIISTHIHLSVNKHVEYVKEMKL